MGPFPDVEGNPRRNFNEIAAGGVKHPAVLEYEATIFDI
jgi:hypothetical protein